MLGVAAIMTHHEDVEFEETMEGGLKKTNRASLRGQENFSERRQTQKSQILVGIMMLLVAAIAVINIFITSFGARGESVKMYYRTHCSFINGPDIPDRYHPPGWNDTLMATAKTTIY